MKRVVLSPRIDLQSKVFSKITYGDEDALWWSDCEYDRYWNEEGKVELSQKADKKLMEATN